MMAYSELVPLVRLRIADKDPDPEKRLLTDEDIQELLDAQSGNAWRAAGDALLLIATSEVLVSKAIRTQDLQTNGDRVAQRLESLADKYYTKADEEELAQGGSLHLVPFGGSRRAEGQEYRAGGVY